MNTPLTDEYLNSIDGLQQAEVSPYFYTRLKGRMQVSSEHRHIQIKPSFAIILLTIFLAANTFFLSGLFNQPQQQSTVQAFAANYNLSTYSNY